MSVRRLRRDLLQARHVHLVRHTDRSQPDVVSLRQGRVLQRQLRPVHRHVIHSVRQDNRRLQRTCTSPLARREDLRSGQVESVVQVGPIADVRDVLDGADETRLVLVSRQAPLDRRHLTEQHEADLHVVRPDRKEAGHVDQELLRDVPVPRILVVNAARRVDDVHQVEYAVYNKALSDFTFPLRPKLNPDLKSGFKANHSA